MRIGISCYPTFGGSGVVASELAMALADGIDGAPGDQVHVISYAMPSRLAIRSPNLFFHEVVVPRYPLFDYPPYSLALATKMVEVARHARLDVMHVHYAVPNAVSAVLARQILAPHPLPVVTTLHGTDVTLVGIDPNYLETTRFGIEQSDAVTTPSAYLREVTLEQLGIELPIDVVPNFIDPDRFDPAGSCQGGSRWAQPGEKLLVHISNFRPVKRVHDVLATFHRVHTERPDTRLLMVGDGPDRSQAEQYCRTHGFCDAVTFTGTIFAVEEVLIGADLFLFTSESESFGLAILEAMACGVPVVATGAGGVPEVIDDGVTGTLHPVGDVDAMAASALELLADDDRRRRFGRAGRKRAVGEFGESEMVGRYRGIYQRVLAKANGAAAEAEAATSGAAAGA
ncbi:MAG TPA: N-acetyl-alpha-D-glucosaminyl L-malate synthase BshA [Thermoanaerobaculia bacterium]|nr:N-acetyl-alpha-D-glucosaminyl L-malate synthase BshA [Thermoanaerobaculia bacterium]